MKILITGANGLLGQQLVRELLNYPHFDLLATSKGELRISGTGNFQYSSLDITDGARVFNFITTEKPGIIIHAAAMTQVDECETDKQQCYNTNVTATRFLVDGAKNVGAKIIYVSTDFVFDGKSGPYDETDQPDPVNYYGSTKWAAENAIIESGLKWAIVRTVLVYGNTAGSNRSNIITWVKNSLEQGKQIKVVTDQLRTPTFVEDLARGIRLVIEKEATGIFHIAGKDLLSPYDMAMQTAEFLKLDKSLIEKADSSTFRQIGIRPSKTGFKIDKARKELGYEPVSFREGLEKVLENV